MAMSAIRRVSDDEVAHYRQHGWVFLPRLLEAVVTSQLLQVAQVAMGLNGEREYRSARKSVAELKMWLEYDKPSDDHESFNEIAFSSILGSNAKALLGRTSGIRYWGDQVSLKLPRSTGLSLDTPWHQDSPYIPIDRSGDLTFWIALTAVTPDHGSMRFLDSSHHEGELGPSFSEKPLIDRHPELLERYPETQALSYRPGDATVHHGSLIHGAPANETSTGRWSYIVQYLPSDSLISGATNTRLNHLGLQIGSPLDHPLFPIVCE
jgi:Phytanoyl-CoA dioxygenase (PhyH)